MGVVNIDSRLRRTAFLVMRWNRERRGWSVGIDEVATQNAILLVGSNIRREQPLLAVMCVRQFARGATVGNRRLR